MLTSILSGVKKLDILSPEVAYPLSVLFFIIYGLNGATFKAILIFLFHLVTFLLAFQYGKGISLKKSKKSEKLVYLLGVLFFFTGITAEIISLLYLGKIPLFYPSIRKDLPFTLTYLSFLLVPGALIWIYHAFRSKNYFVGVILFLINLFLVSLLGYRTEMFVFILSFMIISYYYLGKRKTAKVLAFLVILALILNSLAISFRSGETLGGRFSATLGVFSFLVEKTDLEGAGSYGTLHQSIFSSVHLLPGPTTGPRTFVSQIVGVEKGTTTSTILGLPYADFGLIGVAIFSILLGIMFGMGYKKIKQDKSILPIHALCFSFLIVGIETGIGDVIVIFYFLLYIFMVIR